MEIELDNGEVLMATMLGLMRNTVARSAGIKDGRRGPLDQQSMDMDGMGAEVAFCKYFNLYPDFSLSPQSLTFDCLTQLGGKVDVKQTHYPDGRLLVLPEKKKAETTHYVLVTGKIPKFKIVGYAEKDQVFQDKNLKEMRGKKVYMIDQPELQKF
jgi:hypothetical protein